MAQGLKPAALMVIPHNEKIPLCNTLPRSHIAAVMTRQNDNLMS